MPKQFLKDPNSSPDNPVPDALDQLTDSVDGIKEELRHLVAQTCDVSQELSHLDAGMRDLQEVLITLSACLMANPEEDVSAKALLQNKELIRRLVAE